MKDDQLLSWLRDLKLSYFREQHQALAREAMEKSWPPLDFLSRLIEGEVLRRKDRATQRRIQAAHFPVIKVLQQFDWTWPTKINRPQVQNLFRLAFLKDRGNVIFMGGVGLGKTHLATALAYEACLSGHSVLFTTAIAIVAHSDEIGHGFRFDPDRIPVDVGQRSGVCRTVSRSEATLGFVNYSL